MPSPKLPTSSRLLNRPKPAGASAIPHGAFSGPREIRRFSSTPFASNTRT
jgi:hypothetical protein